MLTAWDSVRKPPARLFSAAFPLGEPHAREDQRRTAEGRRGDALVDHKGGGEHRHQRVEVDVVGRAHRAEAGHGGIPQHVAEQRGYDTQEEQVAPHGRVAERCGRKVEGLPCEPRQDGHDAVEEDLARDVCHRQTVTQPFDYERVEHPQQRRREGQQVAPRREVQHEASVEHDEHHADKGQRAARGLPPRHAFVAVDEAQEQGRPDGRRADDQRDVRRRGILQRDVLREEVERSARQPRRREQQLVAQPGPAQPCSTQPPEEAVPGRTARVVPGGLFPPCGGLFPPCGILFPSRGGLFPPCGFLFLSRGTAAGPSAAEREGQQAEVGHREAQQEDLGRGEAVRDEDLRRNEGRAPHRHAEERGQVVSVWARSQHAAPKIRFFCRSRAILDSDIPKFDSFFLSLRAIVRKDDKSNKQ